MGILRKFPVLRGGSSGTEQAKTTVKKTTFRTPKDEYEVSLQCMGEGNFAEVRHARRCRDGQVFALKMFKRKKVDCKMVQAEYYIAQGLRHKNIIATFDLCKLESSFGMLMEYAPATLFDLVASSKLRPGDSERYLADLVSGVEYIHRLGFVHRDLKLENVVIGLDGYAKIIDFGTVGLARHSLTSGTGSLAYMAPEMFTSSTYDPTMADVWSLGIVYACMVLGRFPWTAARKQNAAFSAYLDADVGQPASNLHSRAEMDPRGWPAIIRQFPCAMQRVVRSMLRVQPTRRSKLNVISEHLFQSRNQQTDVLDDSPARVNDSVLLRAAPEGNCPSYANCRSKAHWRLSGETLCSIIEVQE